jgi:anti-anti-sigma regulatory factor
MSTLTPEIHPTVRIHKRLAATYGHVEPFWIEPGAGAGTYVLGGELDVESASELARLVPPPGATEITLDLSGITSIDRSGIRAILEFAAHVPERGVVLSRPSRAAHRILDELAADELPGITASP